MAGGGQDSSDWLQGFLSNDQAMSSYVQDQSHDLQPNTFAEAARVAHQEHEAYLRSQRYTTQPQSQQVFHDDESSWAFEDAYSENLVQSQLPSYGKQPYAAPDQQNRFVNPSNINPWHPPRPIARSLVRPTNTQMQASRPAIEQQRKSYRDHPPENQGRPRTSNGHANQSQTASLSSYNEQNNLLEARFRPESPQSTYPNYEQGTTVPSCPTQRANPRPTSSGMARAILAPTSGLPEVRRSSAAPSNTTSSTSATSTEPASKPETLTSVGAHSAHAAGKTTFRPPPFLTKLPPSGIPSTLKSGFQGNQVVSPRNPAGSHKHTALPTSVASNFDQGHIHGRSSASNLRHVNRHPNSAFSPATASEQFRWRVNRFAHQAPSQVSQPTPSVSSYVAPARPQVTKRPAPSLAASQQRASDYHGLPNQSPLQYQQGPVAQPWNGSSHVPQPAMQVKAYQQPPPKGSIPEAQTISTKRRFGDDLNSEFESRVRNSPHAGTFAVSKTPREPPSRKHISHRTDLAQPLLVEKASMKDSYDLATIARDILISSGQNMEGSRLNEHLEPLLRNTMVDMRTDLGSVRWDLLDPRDPSHRPPPLARAPVVANRDKSVSSASTQPQSSPLPHAHPPVSSSAVSIPRHTSSSTPPVRTPAPIHQPTPPVKPPTPKQLQGTPSLPSSKFSTPQKAPQPSPPSQSQSQPQVVIISPTKMPRGRGPSNGHNGSAVPSPKSTPQYQIFPCRWSDCQSELHNLQSLQSHILKVHIPHNLTCGWVACENTAPMSAADHWEHVLTTHIRPLAWTLGDGPKVSPHAELGDGMLPFSSIELSSRNVRPETVVLPADKSMVASFTRLRDEASPLANCNTIQDGGMQWKEQTGPTIDSSDHEVPNFIRLQRARLHNIAFTRPATRPGSPFSDHATFSDLG